jgi:Fe-S cluster assembly scaffold protein SufB
MHERSAQSWDAMADSAEDTLRRTGVNEAAKAQLAAASA